MRKKTTQPQGKAATGGATPNQAGERPAPEILYTIDEIMEAARISRPTVYRLINAGSLPVVKIGTCSRIPASAFNEAVANGFTQKYRRF